MDIIIGFDSLETSGYIFDDLKNAGLPPDSSYMLISATDIEPLPAESEQDIQELTAPDQASWQREISPEERTYLGTMLQNARRYAKEKEEESTRSVIAGAERLRTILPSATIDFRVIMSSPFDALCGQAQLRSADLVIVGSQNASSLTRFFLGSVSQKVITYCETPVRIARPQSDRKPGPPRLLVAFDGSAGSRRAVDVVARRAWPEGTQARVVTVAEHRSTRFFLSSLDAPPKATDASGEIVTTLASAAAHQLQSAGIEAHAHGVAGDPKKVLLELAEDWNADCLILGAKGHKNSPALSLGAIASAIATRAHCSVEVIR